MPVLTESVITTLDDDTPIELINSESLTVNAGVSVTTTGQFAEVVNAAGSNTIVIRGTLYSRQADGILSDDGGLKITVAGTGTIVAESYAISALEGGNRLTNAGTVAGYQGPAVRFVESNNVITNSGTLRSYNGTAVLGDLGLGPALNNKVNNTGTIESLLAIGIGGAALSVTNSGLIKGGLDAIALYNYASSVFNGTGGAGADTLIGGANNDTYNLGADTTDTINDASGNDTILSTVTRSLVGTPTIEILMLLGAANINGTGNGLINTLIGNAGANVLRGGGQGDTLIGGAGSDSLYGEAGDDGFVYLLFSDSPAGAGQDKIYGFDVGSNDFVNLQALAGVDSPANFAFSTGAGNTLVSVTPTGFGSPQLQITFIGGAGLVDIGDFIF